MTGALVVISLCLVAAALISGKEVFLYPGGALLVVALVTLAGRHADPPAAAPSLVNAGRFAALGEVASSLAHEINNPLMYVMANLEFVCEETNLPTDALEAAKDARSGAERIAGLVRDLKTYAQPDAPRAEAVDLAVVVESTARLVHGFVRRRAALEVHAETAMVSANREQLGQLVINLIVDAVRRVPRGDPATHKIRVSSSGDGVASRLVVAVRGDGSAFEPDDGLGLAVAQNIAAELGGTVNVTIAPTGRSVRVRLPAAEATEGGAGETKRE